MNIFVTLKVSLCPFIITFSSPDLLSHSQETTDVFSVSVDYFKISRILYKRNFFFWLLSLSIIKMYPFRTCFNSFFFFFLLHNF